MACAAAAAIMLWQQRHGVARQHHQQQQAASAAAAWRSGIGNSSDAIARRTVWHGMAKRDDGVASKQHQHRRRDAVSAFVISGVTYRGENK